MQARERNDLIISWLTVSFAFAWIQVNVFAARGFSDLLSALVVMLVAVGAGFILHELAHKYVAIHYGAHAEFVMWKNGLILAVILAITIGIVFAAPGAVYVMGRSITTRQNGIISWAGPLTNLAIVLLFGMVYGLTNPSGFLKMMLEITMYINLFLAAFNMVPIFPLDGSKVFAWSKTAWALTIAVAAAGVVFFSNVLAIFSMF